MRMRKKKHGEERLGQCSEYLYNHEGAPLTSPSVEVFGEDGPVYLEIGAGKGGFAVGMTAQHPDVAYFAMERVTDCVVLAAERAKNSGSDKLRFIIDTADNLTKIFAKGSVDAIFLNFSDPWSKKGYRKRRLTYRKYLALYFTLLEDGGALRFKTDNKDLFEFSLEEIASMGLSPDIVTYDLHNSPYNEGNVRTEYENNFAAQGMNIHMLEVKKPSGYVPVVVEETKHAQSTEDEK